MDTHSDEIRFIIEKIREMLSLDADRIKRPKLTASLEQVLGYALYLQSAAKEYHNDVNGAIEHLHKSIEIVPSDATEMVLAAALIRRDIPPDFNAGKSVSDINLAIEKILKLEARATASQKVVLMNVLTAIAKKQLKSAPLAILPASDAHPAIRLVNLADKLTVRYHPDGLFLDLGIKKYEEALTYISPQSFVNRALILIKLAVAYRRRGLPATDLDNAICSMQKAHVDKLNPKLKITVLTTLGYFLLTRKIADPMAAAAHYDHVIDLLQKAETLIKDPSLSLDWQRRVDVWMLLGAAHYLKAKSTKDLPGTLESSKALLTGAHTFFKSALEMTGFFLSDELKSKLIFNKALVLQLKDHLDPKTKKRRSPFTQTKTFKDPMDRAYMLTSEIRTEISTAKNQTKKDLPQDPVLILPMSISTLAFEPLPTPAVPQTTSSSSSTQSSSSFSTLTSPMAGLRTQVTALRTTGSQDPTSSAVTQVVQIAPGSALATVLAPYVMAFQPAQTSAKESNKRPGEDLEQETVKKQHVDLTEPSISTQSSSTSMTSRSEDKDSFSVQSELRDIVAQIQKIGASLADCTKAFDQVVTRVQVLQSKMNS